VRDDGETHARPMVSRTESTVGCDPVTSV